MILYFVRHHYHFVAKIMKIVNTEVRMHMLSVGNIDTVQR